MAGQSRITRVFGAVNIGSFRISAMIAGMSENGEMVVLGSGHRAAQGIRRGYVTDMAAATYAVRDAIERAEKLAGTNVSSVWIGCSGAGLASRIAPVEIEIGGRRIEEEDLEHLLVSARDSLEPDGRMVLHAQPACYILDRAEGIANPKGLHAERLGVDIHVMLADGAPMRNLTEAVQNAHLEGFTHEEWQQLKNMRTEHTLEDSNPELTDCAWYPLRSHFPMSQRVPPIPYQTWHNA